MRERILQMNGSYAMEHGFTESDFVKVELLQNKIASALDGKDTPQVGELVEGSYYDGMYQFGSGMIEKIDGDEITVCVCPAVPWVWFSESGKMRLSMSGGPFFRYKTSDFTLIGEDEAYFCDWGHCGPCGNGAIDFPVKVRKWSLPKQWQSRTFLYVLDEDNLEPGRSPIYISADGMMHDASFRTMIQAEFFLNYIGVTYKLWDTWATGKKYQLSHNFRNESFWKLEDIPDGVKPMKLLSNGSIVDGYVQLTEREVVFYRPNPNAKEVYKPLSIADHRAYQSQYGIY